MTMWFAVAAGLLVVWIGLGLFCAQAFMGGGRARARRDALLAASRVGREARTPVPQPRVAE